MPRTDPYRNFNFLVEIDGITQAFLTVPGSRPTRTPSNTVRAMRIQGRIRRPCGSFRE